MTTAETSASARHTRRAAVREAPSLNATSSSTESPTTSCASSETYHRCVTGEGPPIWSKYEDPLATSYQFAKKRSDGTMLGRILVRSTWLNAMQSTATTTTAAAMAGQMRMKRRAHILPSPTVPRRESSRAIEFARRYPVSTRNMTTPMCPLGRKARSRW